MSGSEAAAVRPGQTTRVRIVLRRGALIAKAFVVTFWFDRAFVEPCQRNVLRRAAEHAAASPEEKLVVVGHTDKTGGEPYNQSLSERRARSVFAHLTSGRDRAAALAELDLLRSARPPGELPSMRESWATREYQHVLQALGHYAGNVDEDHGPLTDRAVRDFQGASSLPVTGLVDDATWNALLGAYLDQTALAVPASQFMDNCPGEILKWLGCGEEKPLALPQPPTENAFRPYRRVELLFVRATSLPCQVPQPDTFNLPAPGAVAAGWCLGPGAAGSHCCFTTFDPDDRTRLLVQPIEPGTITVRGSIRFEDGTPVANAEYVIVAPDGEFLASERPSGPQRGRPVPARAAADGTFEHANKPKGIYTIEVLGSFVVRLAEDPVARGTTVCKHLDGSSALDVVVSPRPSLLQIVDPTDTVTQLETVGIGDEFRVVAEIPGALGDEIVVEVLSRPTKD
jgi:outer membrane protein OmpA-like peptidoglycan-associated protein